MRLEVLSNSWKRRIRPIRLRDKAWTVAGCAGYLRTERMACALPYVLGWTKMEICLALDRRKLVGNSRARNQHSTCSTASVPTFGTGVNAFGDRMGGLGEQMARLLTERLALKGLRTKTGR
jgi:hypothetical protein